MAAGKKLTEFKNPITANSGSIFDISVWLGGVIWVVMFGMIVAMGTKALGVIDSKLPGNQTPGMAPYAQPIVGEQYTVL